MVVVGQNPEGKGQSEAGTEEGETRLPCGGM